MVASPGVGAMVRSAGVESCLLSTAKGPVRPAPGKLTTLLLTSNNAVLEELNAMRSQVSEQTHLIRLLLRDRDERRPHPASATTPSKNDIAATGLADSGPLPEHELAAMRLRLEAALTAKQAAGLAAAPQLSPDAVKKKWVTDHRVISPAELGAAWGGRSRQALEQACGRGELFSFKIKNRRWYPAEFAQLSVEDVKAVCLALKDVNPVSKLTFWERSPGSLGGRTLTQVLLADGAEAAVRTGAAFADEYTGHATPA